MANFSVILILVAGVAAANSVYVGLTPFGYSTTAHSFSLPFFGGFRYGFPALAPAPIATPFAAPGYAPGFPAAYAGGYAGAYPVAKFAPTPVLIKPSPILPVPKIAPFLPPAKIAAGVPLAGPISPYGYGLPAGVAGPLVPGFPGPVGPAFPASAIPPVAPGPILR